MKSVKINLTLSSAAFLASTLVSQGTTVAGTFRDIQFRSLNIESQVLELHNFGTDSIDLDGWRFCTHDETDGFDYTSTTGLNGQSLAAGESLFIHWENDATIASNEININSLGGAWIDDLNATTIGSAISINLYNSNLGGFGSTAAIGDHIQYSFGGANGGGNSNARGSVATGADLWGSNTDWISVDANSTNLLLTGDPFTGTGDLQGSASYSVIPEPSSLLLSLIGATALLRRRR